MLTRIPAGEIRARVSMPEAISAVQSAFLDLEAGHFTQPQRLVFGDGAVLVMSVYHEPTGSAMVKTLSVVADRDPMIMGSVVWSTFAGQLVTDAETITTMRTGAASGVATDLLACRDADRLAVLGAGAQAPDQVRAVVAVRDIRLLTVFSRQAARSRALIELLSTEFPQLTCEVADTAEDAVANADIVCCATSAGTPLFPLSALPDRVHVNAIGSFRPSMRELPAELLATASTVVVDQVEACMAESGEVVHAVESGLLDRGGLLELGSALRTAPVPAGRTVFKSVGVAAQDWALVRALAG